MDNMVYIKIPKYFDSNKFYSYYFLNRINTLTIEKTQKIVLDFSETRRIDPIVIPNLLLIGKKIKEDYRKKAIIYLPDTITAGSLKNYLEQIGFIRYAYKYDLFEFYYNPYGGMEGKKIDPLCRTVYFDGSTEKSSYDIIRSKINRKIQPFAERYLSRFEHFVDTDDGNGMYQNDIIEIIYEMNKNCLDYSGSASFTTFHSRYRDNTINIAISDLGKGFKSSFLEKKNDPDKYHRYNEYQLSLLEKEYKCELEAIIDGINWERKSKIYGLASIIREILELGGWVRIHSNDTQVILTEEYADDIINGNLLNNQIFVKENVKKNIFFDGVHIEIVMPLQRRNVK